MSFEAQSLLSPLATSQPWRDPADSLRGPDIDRPAALDPALLDADPADVARFPEVKLVTIDDLGGWQAAQKKHFADGGVFDQLYAK